MRNKKDNISALPDLNQVLKQAVAFHRAGDIAHAEAGYQKVLEFAPRHPDALTI